MKYLIATLMAFTFTAPALALASNPKAKDLPRVLAKSVLLQSVRKSVASEYGVPSCGAYKVVSYDEAQGDLKVQALCLYEDKHGDGSGVFIRAEGVFYDSDTFLLTQITFDYVG